MSSSLIANRYAKALMKLAEGSPAAAEKAMSFLSVCDEMFKLPEARKVLKSPVMPAELKKSLLQLALQKSQAEKDFSGFVDYVVDAGRTSHIPEISAAFKKMLDDKRGIAGALAVTADPLSDAAKAELSVALEKVFKKKITLQNDLDKSVLGGVVVTVGNYTIDLSLKNRLNSVADFAQR